MRAGQSGLEIGLRIEPGGEHRPLAARERVHRIAARRGHAHQRIARGGLRTQRIEGDDLRQVGRIGDGVEHGTKCDFGHVAVDYR